MSNQRPTDEEIRERLEVIGKALRIGDDAGAPSTDAAMATCITSEQVLLWVLGEDSRFEELYRMVTGLVRSSENIRQQNFRDN